MEIGIDYMKRLQKVYSSMGWNHASPGVINGIDGNVLLYTEYYGSMILDRNIHLVYLYEYVGNIIEDNVSHTAACMIDGKGCENMGIWESKDINRCVNCEHVIKQ